MNDTSYYPNHRGIGGPTEDEIEIAYLRAKVVSLEHQLSESRPNDSSRHGVRVSQDTLGLSRGGASDSTAEVSRLREALRLAREVLREADERLRQDMPLSAANRIEEADIILRDALTGEPSGKGEGGT